MKSVTSQLQQMVPELEKVAGRKFDIDEFRQVLATSRECSDLWEAVLNTASTRPSPLTFFDECIHMGPAVVMRGRKEANDYYHILLAEMQERSKIVLRRWKGKNTAFTGKGCPFGVSCGV